MCWIIGDWRPLSRGCSAFINSFITASAFINSFGTAFLVLTLIP